LRTNAEKGRRRSRRRRRRRAVDVNTGLL